MLAPLRSLAASLRVLSQRAPVPYPVVLATAGVLLSLVPGLPLPRLSANLILLAFVPGLVFEAALDLDLDQLRRVLLPVGLLATVGVLVTVLGVGAATHALLGLGWPSAFLLGAIVAATDPIAVVSILRLVAAPGALRALLEGESLFNDGTGVAVFAAVLATVASETPSLTGAAARFLVLTAGGALIGWGVGRLVTLLLRPAGEAKLGILLTLVAAYGSYLAADALHTSGVVAVVVSGIVVARFAARAGIAHRPHLLGFWSGLALALNAVLFLLVGTGMPATRLVALAPAIVVGWLVMLALRAPLAYLLTPGIPWRWRHLAFWSGLRGALGVALALTVAHTPGADPTVPVIAYGMVLLSLLVQGGGMFAAARWLRLAGGA